MEFLGRNSACVRYRAVAEFSRAFRIHAAKNVRIAFRLAEIRESFVEMSMQRFKRARKSPVEIAAEPERRKLIKSEKSKTESASAVPREKWIARPNRQPSN